MLRKLRGKVFRRSRAHQDGPHHNTLRRFLARNLDHELGGTAFDLAREARTRLCGARTVEHVDLVCARRIEMLKAFTHDYAAARAGEHTAAVVRNINAIL